MGPKDSRQHGDKPLPQDSSLRVTDYIDPTVKGPIDDTGSYASVDEVVWEKVLDGNLFNNKIILLNDVHINLTLRIRFSLCRCV